MGTDKKSFILYADQKGLFDKLPDEIAGKLIKHVFAYMDGDEPETDDLLIQIAFEPIKMQLKRDAQKWDAILEKRSFAGKVSAESRKKAKDAENHLKHVKSVATNPTHVDFVEHKSTHSTVTVNVNDNVTVTDNVNVKKNIVKPPMAASEPLPKSDLQIRFDEFLQMRKKLRKPATDRAIELLKKELSKLAPNNAALQMQIIEQSIANAYLDFYPIKDKSGNFNKQQQPTSLKVNV